MVIYFDNAATTYPKPQSVYESMDSYFRNSANPGRGAHELALVSARCLYETRVKVASFLGIRDASRLIFTAGCTLSINMALKGLAWQQGDIVVTSALEHNAVMRPLRQLEERQGIKVISLPYKSGQVIDPFTLEGAFREGRVRLCVVAQASNLTGDILDIAPVAEVCRLHKVPLMVDAAQAAGIIDPGIEELGIALWCASGHKGLFGPPGVGLLYVSPDIELEPLVAGGTGSASESLQMPGCLPDCLEPGTVPGPAIAGLGAGVAWVASRGVKEILAHERSLARRFYEKMSSCRWLKIYGPEVDARLRSGIIAFQINGLTADRVADLLDRQWGIAVRSGLHCAALAHKTLGTLKAGLVRASFGAFNTGQEVDIFCEALEQIAAAAQSK